jgi:hypothetical protein
MAAERTVGGHPVGVGKTVRTDTWWFEPLWTGVGFLLFALYVNWEMFQGNHYWVGGHGFGGYLSPFYSPLFFVQKGIEGGAPPEHAMFGYGPAWWPWWLPSVSAFFILPFPLLFRLTCYYYRKFYYRAYLWTPPACAVNPMKQPGRYEGERGLLIVQNLHRYALYIGIAFIVILTYDGIMAFFRDGRPGIGVGSVILLINPILLGTWTFGCHAWRHLVGGRKDCFSCDAMNHAKGTTGAYKRWKLVTWLNERHMAFAWISMIWVAFAGIYVRLVSMGVIHDFNTWGS